MSKSISKTKKAKVDKSASKLSAAWAFPGKRKLFFFFIVMSFLLYGNTLRNGYSMDDDLVVENHPLVTKGIAAIPKIITSRYVINESQSFEYRPIVLISYAIESQFFGQNPAVSHFFNTLLYGIIAFVLFLLLSEMFKHEHWIIPSAIALLFLIHPIHNEVVVSLKSRDELLSFLFAILSLRYFLRFSYNLKTKTVLVAIAFLVISMLSKRSSLTMLAIIPMCIYFVNNLTKKQWITLLISLFTVMFCIFLTMLLLLDKQGTSTSRNTLFFENPMYDIHYSWIERLAFSFHTIGFYISKHFLPFPLLVYYGYNTINLGSWSDPFTIVSAILVIVLLVKTFKRIKEKKPFDLGVLWFLIGISMFSNLLVPAVGIVAERFAFLPSVGFCIAIIFLFKKPLISLAENGIRKSKIVVVPALLIFLLFSFQIISRNPDWKSRKSIYFADILKAPESAKINALIAAEYASELENIRSGKIKEPVPGRMKVAADSAKYYFSRAIEIYDGYTTMYNNLGTIYYSYLNQPDSAKFYFSKAVYLDTNYAQAHFNLGTAYEEHAGVYESMNLYFNRLSNDTAQEHAQFKMAKSDELFQLFRSVNGFSFHIGKYIKGLMYSGSESRLNNYQNELPQMIQQGISAYFGKSVLKPNSDSVVKYLNLGLGQYIRKEIFGDPSSLNEQVIFQVFHLPFYEWLSANNPQASKADFLQYAKSNYKNANDSTILHWNKAIEIWSNKSQFDGKFMTVFDRLNKLYQKIGNADSIIAFNTRFLDNPSFQKELLIIEIGNGHLLNGDNNKAIDYYKKSIEINIQHINRLALIYNQLAQSGNAIASDMVSKWYMSKRKQVAETYYKIGSKLNEMGKGAEAQLYFAEASKYNS